MLTLRDTRYQDVRLVFDEGPHKYNDTLGNDYKSVTTLLGSYHNKFDKDYWLKRKAKELGMSEKRIEAQWDAIKDEACARGTKTHNGLEDGVKGSSMFREAIKYMRLPNGQMITVADLPNIDIKVKELDIEEFKFLTNNQYPQIYSVFDFYVSKGYKIYSEIGAFLIDYLISGTIDILCIRDDGFVIGDWKTNRGGLKFESGYYKKDKSTKPAQETNEWVRKNDTLLAPVNNLPDCNGSVYNLQLSMYAYMVEFALGIPCKGLWLCHIDSDFVLNKYNMPKRFPDGLYHIKNNPVPKTTFYKMNYLNNEVKRILLDRYKEVQATRVSSKSLFD